MDTCKYAALTLLSILAVSSLCAITSVDAAESTPSVPQFTVAVNDKDQIVLTIKNQPFTAYYDTSVNRTVGVYYEVRAKTHGSDTWQNIEVFDEGYTNGFWQRKPYQPQSSSQFTELIFNAEDWQEFQVQALIGYYTSHNDHTLDLFNALSTFTFYGESSGWSGTHTVEGKIFAPSPTPSPAWSDATPPPQPQPTSQTIFFIPDIAGAFIRGIDWQTVALVIMAAAIAVLAAAVLMLWQRVPKPPP